VDASIQITVDIYGHLIPGANRAAVDRLDDDGSMQLNATQAQLEPFDDETTQREIAELFGKGVEPHFRQLEPARRVAEALIRSSSRRMKQSASTSD
jgi:hypothetical protein